MKISKSDHEAAVARLRELVKPGDTLHTILRHVSRSGMSRSISVVRMGAEPHDITWLVARAVKEPVDQKAGGVKMGGCGMDMGFALVYNLSSVLFPAGFTCVGDGGEDRARRCPSNDHSNGDRDYSPHHHASGGYALSQRWL